MSTKRQLAEYLVRGDAERYATPAEAHLTFHAYGDAAKWVQLGGYLFVRDAQGNEQSFKLRGDQVGVVIYRDGDGDDYAIFSVADLWQSIRGGLTQPPLFDLEQL